MNKISGSHSKDVVEDLGIQQGKVIRPMRVVNPDQDDYPGLIQVGSTGGFYGV